MPATRTPDVASPAGSRSRRPYAPETPRKQNTACAACRKRRVSDDESKVGKIFRRGRKIQELETIYGQYPPGQRPNPEEVRQRLVAVPVLDPAEFIIRYEKFVKRGVPLGPCGELIAQTLLAWATSFGFDESGADASPYEEDDRAAALEQRRVATRTLVQDILDAIDKQGVARRTTWDGVRVLLLVLPLTKGILLPVEKANLYRSALFQVYDLSGLNNTLSENGPPTEQDVPETARARVAWHVVVNEGITSALNGGKLVFDQEDVSSLNTLTSEIYDAALQACPITAHIDSSFTFAPCHLAAVCRLINESLTSFKANMLADCGTADITQDRLVIIWTALEESWKEFDSLRSAGESIEDEMKETFASVWQIFIFGIYNTIRESIWARICRIKDSLDPRSGRLSGDSLTLSAATLVDGMDSSYRELTAKTRLRDLMTLHDLAESQCDLLVDRVFTAVCAVGESAFFELDFGFVEPGLVFLAEHFAKDSGLSNKFNYCIGALENMRWAFSQSESQVQRLHALWKSRRATEASQVLSTTAIAPYVTGNGSDSGFSLDDYHYLTGSSSSNNGMPHFRLYPTADNTTHQGSSYWHTAPRLSPSSVSIGGASEGTRRSSSVVSPLETGGSPVSPVGSVSFRDCSPFEEALRGHAHAQKAGQYQSYDDFLPITPAIPGLSLPSSTFHSPVTDVVRTPTSYGAGITNTGRLELSLQPQVIPPSGAHRASYLESVIPMPEHATADPHEMRSTHSS
ncbi:hypothetical protein FRB90_002785, partial [Tulasnella sp. 427]